MSVAEAPANDDSDSSLAPGFKFQPTDEELLSFYLPRRIANQPIPLNAIGDIEMYGFEPWELPGKAMMSLSASDEWFFFASRDRKYLMGTRANRMTSAGYWKATGKDRPVFAARKEENKSQGSRDEHESGNDVKSGRIVGYKKGHVFYKGRAPHGEKTVWVMHYRLAEPSDDPLIGLNVAVAAAVEASHGFAASGSEGGSKNAAAPGRTMSSAAQRQKQQQQQQQQHLQLLQQGTTTWVVIRLYKRDAIPFQGDGAKRIKLSSLAPSLHHAKSVSLPSSPQELASAASFDDGVDEESAEDDVTAVVSDAEVVYDEESLNADLPIVGRVTNTSTDIVGAEHGTFSGDGGENSGVKCAGNEDKVGLTVDSGGPGSIPVRALHSLAIHALLHSVPVIHHFSWINKPANT
ncbi:unnamed protein product [Closterium sp. NIES-65]|nr:unnamed protein product [Closterium sp. NIES-65]